MNNKRKWIVMLSSIPLLASIGRGIFDWINYDYSLTPAMSEVVQLNVAFSGAILLAAIFFSNNETKNWLNAFEYEDDEITDEECVTVRDILLAVVVLVVVVGTVAFLWKTILSHKAEPVDKVSYIDIQHDEIIASKQFKIEHNDAGWFYYSENGRVLGPFQYIFQEDLSFHLDNTCRYINKNGFYGYFDREGEIITEGIFLYAAKFENGTAKVKMEKDKIYYIDENGNAITKKYMDGSEAYEMQGKYCRVKTSDGKWGIINRDDKLIISDCDSIEKLPTVTTFGSAVIDNHAVLFELDSIDDGEFKIIKVYPEFNKISEVHLGAFAFVWNAYGQVGVVNSLGDIIVEPIYDNVEYRFIGYKHDGTDFSLDNILFLALDQEGISHVIKIK